MGIVIIRIKSHSRDDRNVTRSPNVPENNAPNALRRVRSQDLLAGGAVVLIDHEGAEYQLRLTRQGKLILTK